MLKHYIKFTLRNFRSNKTILLGSLLSLCLGTLCASLLFTYTFNELTIDNFHENKKRIYLEVFKFTPNDEWSNPPPAIDIDYSLFPELETAVSVPKLSKKYKNAVVYHKKEAYYSDIIIADTAFFKIFDFKLKTGNKETFFNDPYSVILSEKISKLLFGDKNPVGEKIRIKTSFEATYTIKNIIQVPSNSSITFDLILPEPSKTFGINYHQGGMKFILVNETFNEADFIKKVERLDIVSLFKKNLGSQINYLPFNKLYYKDIALRADILSRRGDSKTLKILFAIILVIIIIPALNFSNAQIINMNNSAKYIAITAINGAKKSNTLYQKLTEFIILYGIAFLFVSILYKLVLPFFNNIVKIELQPSNLTTYIIIGATLVLTMILAFVYPLLKTYNSSAIRGVKHAIAINTNLKLRKTILVFQYVLTMVLLICSILVSKQLDLMLGKDLGFKTKNIVRVKFYNKSLLSQAEYTQQNNVDLQKLDLINNELSTNPLVINFSQGMSPITLAPILFKKKDSGKDFSGMNFLSTGINYRSVFGLTLQEGRWFDNNTRYSYNKDEIIINEAAKKFLEVDNINNATILSPNEVFKGYKIIGVIKNFNNEHLAYKPKPLVLFPSVQPEDDYFITLQENGVNDALISLGNLFKKVNPNETFKYTFLSDEIVARYDKEKRLSLIYILFTLIALLISAIGLFTIALYDTQRRVKEIGIRKVNGAAIKEVMLMLNKDFMKWVLIAFIIACPIAYYAMSKWLENFAYKTSLSWWVFALAGVFMLVIALLTVSWQSYRAASRNPVESLRDE
ncbi:FtsX-like permease family protein [Flavivirga rizhaonensis]|uniref:ABC transporter permease n=1 Tax=Flavivirga rizhaonensis TaxID=2559571 RepID=A0A4V3P503_9FLAO|nr:ABC transporter permease [Flavivirga rizhaonensis]TGV03414.1 ABC transporter permease [Flavivirga rizhaonensis]